MGDIVGQDVAEEYGNRICQEVLQGKMLQRETVM